ncbi:hypothetical protein HAX54_048450 [Datura stramonium]|uniref:Transmembrane protein n=1 Tax=Datura stramonium TaxID=4076 RepID=A0ABS8RHC4_DATST|nr:hypothetical protein [Datura stramonium]
MALIQDSPKKKQRKISCFGFFNQQKDSVSIKRKHTSCFSFMKFQREESSSCLFNTSSQIHLPVTGHTIKFNKAKHEDILVENSSCGNNFVIGSAEDSQTVSVQPQITKRNKQSVLAINKVDEEKHNFDSVIGMSILMVTLIIMLFWGKFCAILCTSAWFYFLHKLRANNNDVNSNECKKKVVLNGFLQR